MLTRIRGGVSAPDCSYERLAMEAFVGERQPIRSARDTMIPSGPRT